MGAASGKLAEVILALEGGERHSEAINSSRVMNTAKLVTVEPEKVPIKHLKSKFPGRRCRTNTINRLYAHYPKKFTEITKRIIEGILISERVRFYVGFSLEFKLASCSVLREAGMLTKDLDGNFDSYFDVLVVIKQQFQHEAGPLRVTTLRGFILLYYYLKDLWDGLCVTSDLGVESPCIAQSFIQEHSQEMIKVPSAQLDNDKLSVQHCPEPLEDDEDENLCPICMEREVKYLLTCSHTMCQECYEDWIKRQTNCPTCRTMISTDDESEFWVFSDERVSSDEATKRTNALLHLIHDFLFCLPRIVGTFEDLIAANNMARNSSKVSHNTSASVVKRLDVPQ